MASTLANALAFARRGHSIVVLHWPVEENGQLVCSCRRRRDKGCTSPAKHPFAPFAPNGLLDAVTDAVKIRDWFTRAPDANYGVVTNGSLFVLDVDPKRDGDEALAALEREHGPLPHTWRAISGSQGEHILFNAEGLDLRRFAYNPQAADLNQPLGIGIDAPTYIVGVGSRHICGRHYEWNVDFHPADTPLAVPPDWLLQKLSARPDDVLVPLPKPAEEWLKITRQPVTEYRDRACASFAGYLIGRLDPVVALDILFWWNQHVCRPPLDDAEVHRVWKRIVHRHAERLHAQDGTYA